MTQEQRTVNPARALQAVRDSQWLSLAQWFPFGSGPWHACRYSAGEHLPTCECGGSGIINLLEEAKLRGLSPEARDIVEERFGPSADGQGWSASESSNQELLASLAEANRTFIAFIQGELEVNRTVAP